MVLLRPEEAADKLRISRTSLYSLLQRGEVRSVMIAGRRLVAEVDLDAYIERLRVQEAKA